MVKSNTMDAYNNGGDALANAAVKFGKEGMAINTQTGDEIGFAESISPTVKSKGMMVSPMTKAKGADSEVIKERTLKTMFGDVVESLAMELRSKVKIDREDLVEVYFDVGTSPSEILKKTGLPVTYFYAANMGNTEIENGTFLVPRETYREMDEEGLLEEQPRRSSFGAIGLDFPERD